MREFGSGIEIEAEIDLSWNICVELKATPQLISHSA